MEKKVLVAYFSASGVTAKFAHALADATGADTYEIVPKVKYTDEDLDWRDPDSRSSREMRDLSSRPELADRDADVAPYDVILLGFPIWWHVAPTIVNTFLESYDFAGKRIILFATSGSSDFGKTAEMLRGSVDASAVIEEGLRVSSRADVKTIAEWGRGLAL